MQLPEWQGVWQIFGRHLLGEPRYGRQGTPREAPSCVTTPWNRMTIPPLVPCWTPRGTDPDDRPTAPSRITALDHLGQVFGDVDFIPEVLGRVERRQLGNTDCFGHELQLQGVNS
jgi:hypothetical protein